MITDGSLPPCPQSPNCVSSQAERDSQRIEPLRFTGDPARAMDRLRDAILGMPRATIEHFDATSIHAVFRTRLLRFRDDVQCVLDGKESLIHIRSASRVGYSDLGANRSRVERIRQAFETSLSEGQGVP